MLYNFHHADLIPLESADFSTCAYRDDNVQTEHRFYTYSTVLYNMYVVLYIQCVLCMDSCT